MVRIKRLTPGPYRSGRLHDTSLQMDRLARGVFSQSDASSGLQELLKGVIRILGADRAVLFVVQAGTMTAVAEGLAHVDLPRMRGYARPRPAWLERVEVLGGAVLAADGKGGEQVDGTTVDAFARYGITVAMVIPLHHRSTSWYLSVHDCREGAERTLEDLGLLRIIGAMFAGYLHQHAVSDLLQDAIGEFLRRIAAVTHHLDLSAERLLSAVTGVPEPQRDDLIARRFPGLSRRQREILMKLDLPNKVVASHLGLSESTVKGHVGVILRKLGQTDRHRAYQLALAALVES